MTEHEAGLIKTPEIISSTVPGASEEGRGSNLRALVMNHHQVVDDVQSELARRVQLQHVTLLTGTFPEPHRGNTRAWI